MTTFDFKHPCTLPSDQLRDREAMMRRDLLPLVTRIEPLENGMAFEFAYSAAIERTLEEVIAFERECCGSLAWELHRPSRGVLRLSVQGIVPASEFFRSVCGPAGTPRRGRSL